MPAKAEWRATDMPFQRRGPRCRSRYLGTRLALAAIRRAGRPAHAERMLAYDRRLQGIVEMRKRIVAALDAVRKKVQGALWACQTDWLDGLSWEDAALREVG